MPIHLKYVKENHEHQKTLDKAFNGKVVAVDRYINPRANTKYACIMCGQIFYQKPEYLLDSNNEYNHFCILKKQPRRNTFNRRKRPSSVSEELKGEMLALHKQGLSISEISRGLGISRDKVRYWLNKLGGQ